MYQSIINDLDFMIKEHNPKSMTEEQLHYYKQGISVAKQIIEQAEGFNSSELAYETLEATLKAIKNHLTPDEVLRLVDDLFEYEN